MSKRTDGLVQVVHTLEDALALELVDHHFLVLAANAVKDELGNTGFVGTQLNTLVNVAIGMTSDGDGLFPVLHHGLDARDGDGSAEYGTVEDGTDGAVGALPHLVQLVLVHTFQVGGDGSALHANTILLASLSSLDGDLVTSLVALYKTQVVVLTLEVYKRKNQFVLDHLPQDAGHLVTVHLHDGSGHFNFFHLD